jgi:adenine-specific DNA-methyltransferase
LNFRRKEIERFIEKDLIEAVEAEFKEYAKAGMVELQRDVERLKAEIIRDFGEETIDAQGRVMKHEDAPKIKEYLRKVEELKSAEVSEAQMNEVFNHVYEFFSRYYDKGDFISKRRYGGKEKYYVPYNGEEVVLHWANKDQYYVKTAEYFRNYHFKAGGYRVNFLLREAEVEVNNVVGENKYFVLCDSDFVKVDEEKRVVDIYFEWRALTDEEERKFGKRNVQDALVVDAIDRIFSETSGSGVGSLLRVKENGEKTVLEKHVENYVRRNTTDYFIHKNLKAFLERELEFYIKNEVVDLDELESLDERSLRIARAKVKAIREISRKIIEFLAQIEDFQKMLFEKKKFIIGTEYVITLDKIKEYAGEEFLESIADEILKNRRLLEEWKEILGIEVKNKKDLMERQTFEGKEWKKLSIDTQYFGIGFKIRLLEALSERNDLDEILDGILIKSENWQALNLLKGKYKEKIQCIYIDPPYNTGSDEFIYKDNYQHSCWLSMMADRLKLGMELLLSNGAIFISIDYNEMQSLQLLMQQIFGLENFRNTLLFRRGVKSVQAQFETIESLTRGYEYVLFYSKNPSARFKNLFKKLDKSRPGSWNNHWRGTDRPTMRYELFGKLPKSGQWRWSEERSRLAIKNYSLMEKHFQQKGIPLTQENIDKWYQDEIAKTGAERIDLLRHNKKNDTVEHYVPPSTEVMLNDVWFDISPYGSKVLLSLFGENVYDNPKPVPLIKRIVHFMTNKDSIVLDFFAGSGTTAHAVMELNKEDGGHRKFILVELADFFDSIIIARLKKIAYSLDWNNGKPQSMNSLGGFFKYHYVEQYEDTLNNIVFLEKDKTVQETLDEFGDYLLKNMLEFETRGSPTRLNVEQFQTPFDYKIWVTTAGEKKLANVDLVETFNYLLGITVEKFRTFKNQEREYRCIFGKLNQENIAIIWRNTKDIDLKKDKEFIENTILAGTKPDRIFINGDSLIEKAEPIEPEFKRLMGA